MIKLFRYTYYNLLSLCLLVSCGIQEKNQPDIKFDFDGSIKHENYQLKGKGFAYNKGIDGQALVLNSNTGYNSLELNNLSLDGTKDFSIQCWIKTTSNNSTVFLSQKDFNNKSIIAQKNAGWALYSSKGTFGWSIGSGKRRINYERDNGENMPVDDGNWHQITMTFSKENSEFRLYYDGHNKAIYKVNFDFSNKNPFRIGTVENTSNYVNTYSPDIKNGLKLLQELVDEFNALGLESLKNKEFLDLIVDPEDLLARKLEIVKEKTKLNKGSLSKVLDLRKEMGANPYTVFQNMELTVLKPINKIYSLQDGKVVINESAGKSFTNSERLFPSDFKMDKLYIWRKTINEEEVLNSYKKHKKIEPYKLSKNLKNLNVGVWNIWHGGIHWSLKKDGWDSRMRIVEIIKEKNLDIVLLQETYSSGDFIAAELGYYFTTTSDWDYKYQGANISVISRYPIKEVKVAEETEFNNVAVKISISKTQEVWAMSNWYGMNNFPKVFNFHNSRFKGSDSIPVFFGGDFNAVPHTDGGKSPASKKMIEEGFIDAYRNMYPDVKKYPGFTHMEDLRIDQLYYKGKGLKNSFTEVISTWPSGFPSDHFLIVSKFELTTSEENVMNIEK